MQAALRSRSSALPLDLNGSELEKFAKLDAKNKMQIFGGLVLGCIETKFCKILQVLAELDLDLFELGL